jgi:hypothetical protein
MVGKSEPLFDKQMKSLERYFYQDRSRSQLSIGQDRIKFNLILGFSFVRSRIQISLVLSYGRFYCRLKLFQSRSRSNQDRPCSQLGSKQDRITFNLILGFSFVQSRIQISLVPSFGLVFRDRFFLQIT